MKIDLNELTREEIEVFRSAGSNSTEALKNLINRKSEVVSVPSNSNVASFINDRLELTSDYKDMVSLKDTYELYCEYMQYKIGGLLGKKVFRKAMLKEGVNTLVARGNKRMFCFVKFKIDEDEEWEL